jgi:predicted O-methyltransferase YrrM
VAGGGAGGGFARQGSTPRGFARRGLAELRSASQLRVLPPRVAWFQWRARRIAKRTGDRFSLDSVTRPANLGFLLRSAQGRRQVVELGTATAWTSLSLALADRTREVLTYDPIDRPERERYLALVDAGTRKQVTFVSAPGSAGPMQNHLPVDLLYVDSSHGRAETIEEMSVWRPVLGAGALVIFDDYGHPDYPGVREAIDALRLTGRAHGALFVHEVP